MLHSPASPEGHLLPLIGERARTRGDEPALGFVEDGSGTTRTLSWSEVESKAWRARKAFEARGLRPGDRVVLALPTSEAYLSSLLGALWGGLVPSTLSTPSGPATSPGVTSEWQGMIESFAPSLVVGENVPPAVEVPVLSPGRGRALRSGMPAP